jgi:hypothetical protein
MCRHRHAHDANAVQVTLSLYGLATSSTASVMPSATNRCCSCCHRPDNKYLPRLEGTQSVHLGSQARHIVPQHIKQPVAVKLLSIAPPMPLQLLLHLTQPCCAAVVCCLCTLQLLLLSLSDSTQKTTTQSHCLCVDRCELHVASRTDMRSELEGPSRMYRLPGLLRFVTSRQAQAAHEQHAHRTSVHSDYVCIVTMIHWQPQSKCSCHHD